MVVQPSTNSTHSSPNVILDRHPYSNTFRKNPNRFRIGDVAFTMSGGRRRTDGRRARRTYHGLVSAGVDAVLGALEPMERPRMKRSGKQMKEGRHDSTIVYSTTKERNASTTNNLRSLGRIELRAATCAKPKA